jgi:signal transduction histidine kinase/ActR/RegA family two-component response regulator
MADPADSAERILVLTPLGRDGALAGEHLRRAGLGAVVCPHASALAEEMGRPAGAAIVAHEALTTQALAAVGAEVARQPPWSDFPLVVLAPAGELASRMEATTLAALGNVTVLERPLRVVTLLSAVQAALRARRRQYEVRDLLAAQEEAVAQRDRFLATLGHELRNPLAAMLSASALAEVEERRQDETLSARLAWSRAILRRQGEILTRLVDDLLEVSRLSTGKVHLERSPVNLDDLVRRSVETVRLRTGRADITLRCGPEPSWVDGDPVRLEQVLLNLLTNAVKYTPSSGAIAVECRQDRPFAEVTVADEGVGIGAELLPHVFDMFKQADVTLNRAQGGLGIGLTLVRALVEMHGGMILAESPGLGHGSRFTVRLPLTAAPVEATPGPDAGPEPSAVRRIFVIEDQADTREALVALLTRLGHLVESAGDGLAGADGVISTRPEVALVDIGLPGIDGYEVARRVRTALGPSVFLVALTGYGQVEDRHRAAEAGFDLHVSKPVGLRELTTLLASPPDQSRRAR